MGAPHCTAKTPSTPKRASGHQPTGAKAKAVIAPERLAMDNVARVRGSELARMLGLPVLITEGDVTIHECCQAGGIRPVESREAWGRGAWVC